MKQLAARLGHSDWLDAFSAGDLMMVHVLERLKPSGILDEFASLAAHESTRALRSGGQASA